MATMSNALKDSHFNVSLSLSLLYHKGELQRSCSQTVAEKVSEQCQLACHCRRYPPLPPPPPPPPPPRLLGTTGKTPSSHCQFPHLSRYKSVRLTLSACSRFTVGFHSSPDAGVKQLASLKKSVLTWSVSFYAQKKMYFHRLRLLRERPCMGTVFFKCASVRVIEPAGC